MASGQKASGYETKGWACPSSSEGMVYHDDNGLTGWHVWGYGITFLAKQTDVEIGYYAGAPMQPGTNWW